MYGVFEDLVAWVRETGIKHALAVLVFRRLAGRGPRGCHRRRAPDRDTLNDHFLSSDWPSSGFVIAPATAFFDKNTGAVGACMAAWLRPRPKA